MEIRLKFTIPAWFGKLKPRNKYKNKFEARKFYMDLKKRAKLTYRIASATKGSGIPTENNFL